MKFNRDDLKAQLRERAQESYETKDDGGKFSPYWTGMPFPKWKCGDGEHVIDVVMFPAGENYPTKSHLKSPPSPDKWVTWLDVWVHTNVGPNEDMVICNASSYGEPCFICEDVASLRRQKPVDEELIKEIKAKRRAGYLIICRDSEAEERKGLQFFEVSHFHMEKELAKRARKPLGGGFILYADPWDGKSVYFRKEGKGLDAFSEHNFIDRDYAIPDEMLEKVQPLANFLTRLTYEEVKKMHLSGTSGSTGDSQAEAEEHYEPPTRAPKEEPAPTRTRQPLKTEEEPPTRATRATRSEPKEESEKKEEPPKRAPRRAVREEPPKEEPANKEEAGDNACPAGGKFGVDIDKLQGCMPCEIWDDCAAESQRLEEAEKKSSGGRRARG